MEKRLVSVLCILSLLTVCLPAVETYAASNEPEKLPINTPDLHGEWVTEGLSDIRVENAGEALALLTGGTREGRKAIGPSAPVPEYALKDLPVDKAGQGKSYQFQQTYGGIPIYGMVRIVNTQDGYVQAISGDDDTAVAGMSLPKKPALTGEDAIAIGLGTLDLTEYELAFTESELCYYAALYEGAQDLYHLSYRVEISGFDTEIGAFYWAFFIDAATGRVLKRDNIMKYWTYGGSGYGVLGDYKSFTVYRPSGETKEQLRDLDRHIEVSDLENSYDDTKRGITSKDSDNHWYDPRQGAEVDAYVYLRDTYDYFYNTLGWQSFDNDRAYIYGCTHYGANVCNAFWNGLGFYFGDGDARGRVCLPLSGAPDIVAHEFTHAVTDYTAELRYYSISGALNEAFSDIFGALAENAPDTASFYRIAERIWRSGPALRDMAHPSQYGMPEKMSQYKHIGEDDQGGVHVNCSIPCKAFYIMGQSLGRDQLANIWFSALRDYLTTYSDFWDAREATIQAATVMYGDSAASVVASAWNSVGVTAVNPDTHGDILGQSTRYNYGDIVSGSIEWAGDFDCFIFTPAAGGTYDFYTTGGTDTFGAIMDVSGEILAADDDSGDRYNFRVSHSLLRGNTYYLVVCHADEYGHGGYTLRSSAVIDPVTSLSMTLSPSSSGEIKKRVTVRAVAGPEKAEYQFQVKKSTASSWTNLQSYRENDSVEWTPDTPGMYDIRVRARSVGRTSDYDLERRGTYEATDIPSLTGVVLDTGGGTVRENCTRITLTAIPQGAESETDRAQYQFLLKQGGKWTTVQTWSAAGAYEWTPTKTGAYSIQVQVRTQGRSGIDADACEDFDIVYPEELEGVDFYTNPGMPSEKNTDIVLTAAAFGDQSYRAEYLFRVKSGKTWSTLRGWGPIGAHTWTPTKTGGYTIEVQARTIGRPAADHTASMDYAVVDIYPLDEVKLSSAPAGMQPTETEIRLSAVADGSHADNAEYLYQYSTDGKKWRAVGDGKWTKSPDVPYTPKSDAEYLFRVQARSVGRSGVDVSDIISQRFYKGPKPVVGVFLSEVVPADIQETGEIVRFAATALGDAAGDAEYLFRVKRGSRWTTLRDWDSANTYEWKPDREGAYAMEVQARTRGRNGIDAAADTAYTVVNIFPLTGLTLTGTPAGMQEAGTQVILEAAAAGPYADTAEYLFQYSTDGKQWRSIGDGKWKNSSSAAYSPNKEAVYHFRVQARSAGRSGVDIASYYDQRFYAGPMPVESVTLGLDPPDTQEVQLTTAMSATAYGDAAGDAEYLYRVKQGSRWITVRDWGGSPAYEWTPEKTGAHTLEVQTRAKGRRGPDATDSHTYSIVLPRPLDDVALRADRQSPQEIKTNIVLTAEAQGAESETGRAQYLFRVKLGNSWSTLQDWSPTDICLWEPVKTGKYTIEVQARTKGRTGADVKTTLPPYEIKLPDALTSIELSAGAESPQEIKTRIKLTANAKIDGIETERAEYLFRAKLGSQWKTLRGWGTGSYDWEPDRTGKYTIEVQARTVGRPAADVKTTLPPYEIKLPDALTSIELSAGAESPQEIKTRIRLTANAKIDGIETERAEYLFRAKLGSQWKTLRNWGIGSYDWEPDRTGKYTIEVQARTVGRPAADVKTTLPPYEIKLPDALTSIELSAGADSPQEIKTRIKLTANAKIDGIETERAEYLFRAKLGSQWKTLRNWGTGSYDWEPDKTGKYTIEVQARTVGRPAADVKTTLPPYEIKLPDALTSVELSAGADSPQEIKTRIKLTANAKIDGIETERAEYLFRAKLGSQWKTLRNWGIGSYDWEPDKTGKYTIEVQARTVGRPATDVKTTLPPYEIKLPDALTSVELSAGEESPQEIKTRIKLTANAKIDGAETERAEYLFRAKLGSQWKTLRNWGIGSYDWESDRTGKYTIEVQARTVGRPATDVKTTLPPYEIKLPDALTSIELSAGAESPQEIKTRIKLTANAKIDGIETERAEYLFRAKLGSQWKTLRNWGIGSYDWEPDRTGKYTIEVQARTVGRPAADVKTTLPPYEIKLPDALTSVELSAGADSPQETGTSITLHAQGKIGESDSDRAQYLFRARLGSRWSTLQNWSEEASYTWKPNKTGIYTIEIQARTVGRNSTDTIQTIPYTITGIVPVSFVDVSAKPEAYGVAEESTTISAAADRPLAEYCFLGRLGDGSYAMLQDWSDAADCDWIPGAAGEYTLLVLSRARQQRSVQAVETFSYRVLAVPPVKCVTIETDPEDGQELGGTVEIFAQADQPDAEYQFAYSSDGREYVDVQGFSSDPSFSWAPDATGVYYWRVRARTDASFPQGQAEELMEYPIYREVAIPDAALRGGLLDILDKTPDDIITNLDMAALTDLDCSGWGIQDLTGIEYAVNIESLDLSDNCVHDLTLLQALIDNGGLSGTGSRLDITLNGLDCRGGTPVKSLCDTWIDAGIEVAYLPQHPAVGSVTLTADIESPEDIDTVIHLTAQSDQLGVEYRFTVDDTILSDWTDDDTLVWIPDTAGTHIIMVQARTWGMPETEVADSIHYEILPAPLPSVSIGAVPDGSIEEGNTVILSADGEAGAWYRFQVMGEDGEWTAIGGFSQSNTIGWLPEGTGDFTLCVQAHRDGRPADSVDASDTMDYRVIPQSITGEMDIVVSPESPQELGAAITMSVNDQGAEAEYWFGVQTAEEDWVWTGEWGTEAFASWTPDSPGIYVLSARARARGRDGYDLEDSCIYTVSPPPIGTVSLSTEPEGPFTVGAQVTLTAESEGSIPEYYFSAKSDEEEFTDIQGWSEDNTAVWAPEDPGTYTLRVQVRESGQSEATAEASSIALVAWPSLESLALGINEAVTYQYEPRQLTATANTDRAEFKFTVQNPDNSWSTLQGWTEDSTCEWTPSAAGEYLVQAEGRGIGRVGTDHSDTMTISVYPSPPMREWSACFGGSGMDESKAVRQTRDGGFILAGYTRSTDVPGYKDPNGLSDAYLVKTDSTGNVQWQFVRGGDRNDVFRDVIQTDDGGFIAVGQKEIGSDAYMYCAKVSAQGGLEWDDWYGGSGDSEAYSIIRTGDGNYCIAGYVCSAGFSALSALPAKKVSTGIDGFVLKIKGNGQPVWLKYYGGNALDHLYDIIETTNGSLICGGRTLSTDLNNNFHGAIDGWAVKTNSSGILQWQKAIGGSRQDCFYRACVRSVAGQERVELVGMTQSNDGDSPGCHGLSDGYLVSIDSSGSICHTVCLGGSSDEQIKDIFATRDQGLILLGYSTSEDGCLSGAFGNGLGWMTRTDNNHQVLWQKRFYDMFGGEGLIYEANDGEYIIAGSCQNLNQAYGPLRGSNLLLTKLSSEGVMMPFFLEMAFDRQSPQPPGTPVTVTGISNLEGAEYRFLCYDEAGTETVLQAWSTDTAFEWIPHTAGLYVIKTQARVPQYAQYVETDVLTFNVQ